MTLQTMQSDSECKRGALTILAVTGEKMIAERQGFADKRGPADNADSLRSVVAKVASDVG